MAEWLEVDAQAPATAAVERLRRHLDGGGVAAAPTDTIYGLLANALSAAAVARVFALKGRGFDKPLPLVVRDRAQVVELAGGLPPGFDELAAAFWPGPLTLLVAAGERLAPAVTAGTGSVGVRQARSPLLAALLAATGYPLTATSANRSGGADCRTAAAVAEQLGEDAELLIVDGGPSPLARPSTLVDLTGPRPRVLREGAIPASALAPWL